MENVENKLFCMVLPYLNMFMNYTLKKKQASEHDTDWTVEGLQCENMQIRIVLPKFHQISAT